MGYCPYPTSKKVCEINFNGKCCLECLDYHTCENACKNKPELCGKEECFYVGGILRATKRLAEEKKR